MTEALILHIETATDICSAAISEGPRLLSIVESGQERSHATLLNTFIRQAIKESGTNFQSLDAIAVSKGPGSYTGLRIGVSTAKGLAYALEKPLLSCGTDTNIQIDIDPESWRAQACEIAGRNLTLIEWQQFIGDETYRKTCPQWP